MTPDTPPPFILRRLGTPDAACYRDLRLEGLQAHPEAFGAAWEEEERRPLDWFAERLEQNAVFGGWRDASTLMGIAGLAVPTAVKLKHRGMLWGMYIRSEARGTGLAAALVARVIEEAAGTLEELHLTVTTTNLPAVRLYTRAGFKRYAEERRAVKIGDQYYDIFLMARSLRPST